MKQYIYILKDPLTNIVKYVGKSNNPEERLRKHLSDYSLVESWTSKNKWLLNLVNNNLKPILEVIDECDDSNVDEFEIKWISHYRSLGLELTNMTNGGDGFDWTGKKHSEETINKLKLCHPSRKEVIQFDLNNQVVSIYNSIRECEYVSKLDRSHISRCCKGKYITVGGYYFRYIDNYFPCTKATTEPNIEYIKSKIEEFNFNKITYITRREEIKLKQKDLAKSKRKSVVHYDLKGNILGKYSSMSEARDITKCHIGLISNCCNKKSYYTVNDSTFRYENDIFDYVPYNVSIQVTSRRVCKYDLGGKLIKIYDSVKQAVRENFISSDQNIISCCKRKVNVKNNKFIAVKGFTYRYFEDTEGCDLV
jgi:hypothetical protein